MTDLGNPVLSPWEDIGPAQDSHSSPAQTRTTEPRVSPETKRIIGELSLKYPAPAAISPQEHAAQLALLCRDLIDVPPQVLRQASDRWSRDNRWMPKASDLRALCHEIVSRRQPAGDVWERRRNEGNRMAIRDSMANKMHWIVSNGGQGTEIVPASMPRDLYNAAMTIDPAVLPGRK